MLFNSYEFIFLFVPLTFLGFNLLSARGLNISAKNWLILASLFFYAWWNPHYLTLFLTSIIINYLLTYSMINFESLKIRLLKRRHFLWIGIFFNLGLLGGYKYLDFIILNLNTFLNLNISLFLLPLPLAISFFTLQQIAFLVDSYQGLVKKVRLQNYFIFVSFFPQLIAGPIVHDEEITPQIEDLSKFKINYENIYRGIVLFVIGLAKKTLISEQFSQIADLGFQSPTNLSWLEAWITSLSFTFQIYFDFSGYTDMALGLALFFNITLPLNFNSPFRATGMIEFWQRWHMTLTRFITAYIYNPMLLMVKGRSFTLSMTFTLVTFLIAGLWHGASWNFVFFGGLNGFGLIINHLWQKKLGKRLNVKIPKALGWVLTFGLVNIAHIFFRSKDFRVAVEILNTMFLFTKKSEFFTILNGNFNQLALFTLSIGIIMFPKNSQQISKEIKPSYFTTTILIVVFIASLSSVKGVSEFIYFNF